MQYETGRDAGALEEELLASRELRAGSDAHYRAYVGPPKQYDFMGATQFRLLTGLGLREEHRVLDLGCGSLRAGKFLISYLLPDRYIGVEPNEWLWREAIARELGQDMVAIKRPLFLSDPHFAPEALGGTVDFAVAQSIYSHTGADEMAASLKRVAAVLAPRGQFLFTAIIPGDSGVGQMDLGRDVSGWVYPECVSFMPGEVEELAQGAGLHVQALPWFHPRQTWYRATREAQPLDAEMLAALGTGKPLFDERFT